VWQGSGATWIALRKLRSIQATLAPSAYSSDKPYYPYTTT